MSRFTLYGCYQYDPTLFDDVTLPGGLDKDMLVNKIMSGSGDLYPYHQVPSQLKVNITYWFRRMYYNFQQMYTALTEQYSPIENYNRYEDSENQSTLGSTVTTTQNGSSSTGGESNHSKSAFNSSSYEPVDHDTNSGNASSSSTSASTGSGTDTVTNSAHIHGNIGITTSQSMITDELTLRRFDLYKDIALQFEHEFLIQIY